jgi:hypothetical protein
MHAKAIAVDHWLSEVTTGMILLLEQCRGVSAVPRAFFLASTEGTQFNVFNQKVLNETEF